MSTKDDLNATRKFSICTTFFDGKTVKKINHAKRALNAVPRCVDHMQLNRYSANVAEVFDTLTGELHAVITRSVKGNIKIVYRRELKEGM